MFQVYLPTDPSFATITESSSNPTILQNINGNLSKQLIFKII